MANVVERNMLGSPKKSTHTQCDLDLALLTQDNEVIFCHSIVAAANSNYIQKCLENYEIAIPQPDTNSTYCIKLNHVPVNKNVISKIVVYFYTGKIEITVADVTDLSLAADILQIDRLKEKLSVSYNAEKSIYNKMESKFVFDKNLETDFSI